MSTLVAKRYVKALIKDRDVEQVVAIQTQLNTISSAFLDDKFLVIISSVDVTVEDKVNLLFSFLDGVDDTLKNLIRLLSEKRRLEIIPDIAVELNKEVAVLKNSYVGVVYSKDELSSEYLSDIESSLSKKFDIELSLKNKFGSYDGIKVDIDGLNVEISFSQERLKSQMIDHILRAF